ncbi:MAG TPA: class I adenylate-forming enzyme family protein [Planctomycetota bacterium]
MSLLDASPSPFCRLLARQVRDQARRPALNDVTFRELGERIAARAEALRHIDGLCGLALGNGPSFVESFFALRALGIPVLSLDQGTTPETCRRVRGAWMLRRDGEILNTGPVEPPPAGTDIVKMTSGSTFDPRAACFTEEALVEGVEHIRLAMDLSAKDVVLIAIPLSHSYGFDSGLLSLAAIGTPLVLQNDVLPAALLKGFRTSTFFPAVPALIRALGRVEWPSGLALRSVICASAPLAQEDADAFFAASGLRVKQFLGATEAGGIAFESGEPMPGTVGHPLPGVRIELHDDGLRVHSKANRFALLPGGELSMPWVETGDRGEWMPDGRLRLLGRASLTANIGGFKVDLGALDAFLRGLPGVAEAAALPLEDAARGQRIVAWVESSQRTPSDILAACRERLQPREVPSEVRVVEQLPRNGRGKLDRAALLAPQSHKEHEGVPS